MEDHEKTRLENEAKEFNYHPTISEVPDYLKDKTCEENMEQRMLT